jgi:hypothetical protein
MTIESRFQSARRIARLLSAIGGFGGFGVIVLEWLHVAGISRLWLLLFLPLLLPAAAFLGLLNRHERNCELVARHLMGTRLLPPTFTRFLAAHVADLMMVGMTVMLPVVVVIAKSSAWVSDWASPEASGLIAWSLALAAGWIVLFAMPAYVYVFWLPTTRLQARPGFWLLGLCMTDLEGRRLTRRALHRKPTSSTTYPDADVEEPPAYLLVLRPTEDKNQLQLPTL